MNLALWTLRFRETLELRQYSPRSVDSYTRELRPLFEFLHDRGIEAVTAITRDQVEDYRAFLFYCRTPQGNSLSVRTQASRLGAVKAFLKFLARDNYILWDVAAGLELPRTPKLLPRQILSEREVKALLAAPDLQSPLGIRDRAVLEVLYGTAVRNSELSQLRLHEVALEQRELRIACGKGGKSRVLPMGEEAAAWLEHYLVRSRPLLIRCPGESRVFLSWRGRAFTRGALAQLVSRQARQAGLKQVVTPHVLRHCCATHMLRRGAGIRHLQELLGHDCLSTTQRYTKVEVSDLRRVLRQYHPRERELFTR